MDQTISLLLVDDERAHVRLMERAFARDGVRWRVRVASSLEEARRALLDDPPDLAFVDILLPDGRGVELLEGADEPDYPVVLMTARGDERVAVEAIKRGALDYVVKSEASVRELPRVAERALRQWRDIAGRREALRALQESEERFRNLIEGSIQGVLVHRHWVPLFANQAFAEILGFESADEVLALESIAPFYAPQDRARFASYLESPLGGQDAPSFFELEATRRDGKAVTLQNVIRPITWSGQLALQHSVIDVSEHKRAEAQATRLGRILDDSLNEIYIADADTLALIQVNRGARKNLGYSSKELRARSLPELLPELGRDRLEALFAPLRTGETERVRLRSDLQRKDGSCYPVEANVQLSRADSRSTLICIALDISERLERERALAHAQKMDSVGKLTSGVAHDFNNLLTIIIGNLRLVQQGRYRPEELSELVRDALSAGEDGAELIEQLLAFSRGQDLQPRSVAINPLIQRFSGLLKRSLGESIRLELALADKVGCVRVDPGRLENALLNLAINARDAMPNGGALLLVTERVPAQSITTVPELEPGPYVAVRVCDTGCGMPSEVIDRACEPFFTTKEAGSGHGMGLSMVYGFTRQSEGALTIQSSVGQGTSVTLYLPESTDAPEQISLEARELPRGAETVLIVEDEARVRRFAARSLSEMGYRVIEADHAHAAMDILRREPGIDLLLTDNMMPGGMSGRELAKWAVHRRPELRIIVASGFSEESVQGRADEKQFPFLPKPYSKEALGIKVRTTLDSLER